MATRTTFLQLILPANNEFFNTWDTVVNDNFKKVETKIEEHDIEIINARFNLPTMKEFLEVSHNADGTLKATGETVNARNSRVYGHADAEGDFDLERRLRFLDFETFYQRNGQPNLLKGAALLKENLILEGSKNGLGQPSWLGFTADKFQIDGDAAEIEMLVGGKYQRIRKLEEVQVSGAAGTYFLYAEWQEAGEIVVDGDSTTAPPASANGIAGNDLNGDARIFNDDTVDFTTKDVKPGDILRILGNTAISGDYVIESLNGDSGSGADVNNLVIKGIFETSLSSLDYVIIDSYKPVLGFTADSTPVDDRLFIGECDFDGAAVIAVRPRQFKSTFVGDWRAVDFSGAATNFEEIWNHYLGTDSVDVMIQVSQANDGSAHVETLSLADLTALTFTPDNGTLAVNNTLELNPLGPGGSGAGDQDLNGDVTLTGTVGGSVSGAVPKNSVRAKYDRNNITVKNLISNVFYTDYDGTARDVGFVRVIVKRKEG